MSLNVQFLERIEGRKRNFDDLGVDLDESNGNGNGNGNALILDPANASQTAAKSVLRKRAQLISPSSSVSCEESCSSSSYESSQASSDSTSDPYSGLLVSPNYGKTTTKVDQKIIHSDHHDEAYCSSSSLHDSKSKIIGQISDMRQPYQSNVWDDTSWELSLSASKMKKIDSVGISLAANSTEASLPIKCTRSQHDKAHGVTLAKMENLHSENLAWDDTNWKLPDIITSKKKRKEMGMLVISKKKSCASMSNDDRIIKSDKDRGYKCHSQKNPGQNQRSHLSHVPIIPNHDMGITYLMKNQHLSDHRLSCIDSPYFFYRWLRVRLAAGNIRPSFDFIHRILKNYYDEANQVIKKPNNDKMKKDELESLLRLRDRLAGIWCVYAHFTLEVGCLVFARVQKQERSFSEKPSSQKKSFENSHVDVTNKDEFESIPCSDRDKNSPCNLNGENDSSTERSPGLFPSKRTTVQNFENVFSDDGIKKFSSLTQTLSKASEDSPIKESGTNISRAENAFTIDDFSNHAISILLSARNCPLVGNHTAVGVSLARLIVSSTVMKESNCDSLQVELSRDKLIGNIQGAIDACWDSIDMCRYNRLKKERFTTRPVSIAAITSLSNFEAGCDNLSTAKEVGKRMQEEIKSALLFPSSFRKSLSRFMLKSTGMIVTDKSTILCLCKELNQLSRLEEKLNVNPNDALRISPTQNSEMTYAAEALPLYAPLKCLPDQLNLYENYVTSESKIIWQW